SFLLSNKHRHQLNGIENADSVSWDAHKLLFQTYSCAMVLVKNKSSLLNSFSANPEYLDDIGGSTMDDFGSLGIELTRPTRALKLWLSLQVIGLDQFERMIDGGHELALYTEKEVLNQEDWEIVSNPQFSILNFRYANSKFDNESLNKINKQVANEIVDSGYAGVFTTQLKGKTVLRMCTINPNTTHEDIDNTLSRLNELAIHYAKLA
ncbi:MAG: pyridoxal-dependent decarboxylase, partial [Erysipelothrix sp.]